MNSETKNIVTFGEVLMRLSPQGSLKMQQTSQLDFFFGGTELNVGASLSILGENVKHVTNVSDDFVGDSAIGFIRKFGVDTSAVNKVEHPIGLYFLEVGSGMRASQISYNRLNGSFANISPEMVDWESVLENADFFHWTGITPGISEGAYETLKAGLEIARKKGITITADPAYRSNLWKYGRNGHEVLKELVGLSTILIGGVNEINELLKADFGHSDEEFLKAAEALAEACPSIEKVFDKSRTGVSASWQKITGRAWNGKELLKTEELEITNVVDRIGTGDAFAAGIIYGMGHFNDQKTLEFANAACALKHTIYGDANLATKEEILEVMKGSTGGRIKR